MFWTDKAHVQRIELPQHRRILVVSDIHANLDYFEGLLKKVRYTSEDVLVVDGDFLERGDRNLDILHRIMELREKGPVYVLCGNCDDWADLVYYYEETDEWMLHYLLTTPGGLVHEMLAQQGLTVQTMADLDRAVEVLKTRYLKEWQFLGSRPSIIETEHYTFVHGGIDPGKPMEEQENHRIMKFDDFYAKGYSFEKWVIVGHWPVMHYREKGIDGSPIIDRERKIVCLDGGCVLERTGQLNALIIPEDGSEDFSVAWYDRFPEAVALDDQKESEKSFYISWGDSDVKVLDEKGDLARCRHRRTGYEMEIPISYLRTGKRGRMTTDDCTDYRPEIRKGDRLSVIEQTSLGYLVKKDGRCGWYVGKLEKI